jgi:hypothetical protein
MYISKALGLGQQVHTQASEELVLRQLLKTGLKINTVIDERNVDFFLSPTMAKDPYFPKRSSESREYWMLPEDERRKVTAIVDRVFRTATGIGRKLDPKNPKDKPWIRTWLRLRDQIMVIRSHKTQSTTSSPRSGGITRVNTANVSSSPSTSSTTPVLHLEKVKITSLPEIILEQKNGRYEGVFGQPIPLGGSFKVEVFGRIQIKEAGNHREYDPQRDDRNWPLVGIKGHASIKITTPGLSFDNVEGAKIQSNGTVVFSNSIGVNGSISRLILHTQATFKNGKSLTATVVLMLTNLDTFISLVDPKEQIFLALTDVYKKGQPKTQTRIEFLASVRKMFQPAPGSPLTSMFDSILYRNRKISKLVTLDSEEGKYIRSFEKLTIGNDTVDLGHVLVGIEVARQQKPDSRMPKTGVEIEGVWAEALLTWAGDLGSALEPYAEAVANGRTVDIIKDYLQTKAGPADLLGDIDGINIGREYDQTKSLAENLRQYYGAKPFRRFHDYLVLLRDDNNKPILTLAQQKPPKIDQASRDRASKYISFFANAIALIRRKSGLLNDSQYSLVEKMVKENSREMSIVVGYFMNFVERGLAKES